MWVNGARAQSHWGRALSDVGSCLKTALGTQFCGGQGRGATHTGGSQQRDGCKHADTLKARNHWKGLGGRWSGSDSFK